MEDADADLQRHPGAGSNHDAIPNVQQTMKIRFLLALVGLAIGFGMSIFAQQKDTVDPQTVQQVRAFAMKCEEAFFIYFGPLSFRWCPLLCKKLGPYRRVRANPSPH